MSLGDGRGIKVPRVRQSQSLLRVFERSLGEAVEVKPMLQMETS